MYSAVRTFPSGPTVQWVSKLNSKFVHGIAFELGLRLALQVVYTQNVQQHGHTHWWKVHSVSWHPGQEPFTEGGVVHQVDFVLGWIYCCMHNIITLPKQRLRNRTWNRLRPTFSSVYILYNIFTIKGSTLAAAQAGPHTGYPREKSFSRPV